MANVLEVSGIDTYYGKSHILKGVSLQVKAGELVALLGRNGAGKTTTVRSIMGLTPAERGVITLFGRNTTREKPNGIVGYGVGYVPEGRKIFGQLSVNENLRVPSGRQGHWNLERVYELFPRLRERKDSKGSNLSGGEQEMLAIARVLLINPRLLILDEPSQGLAPVIVHEVMAMIQKMKAEGMSILLIEQNTKLALQDAESAFVIDNGKVIYSGGAADLRSDEKRIQELTGAIGRKPRI